jgi:hypothetical protein
MNLTMLKVKSTLLLYLLGLGLGFSIPVFVDALQPRPALAQQAYKRSEYLDKYLVDRFPSTHPELYFDTRFSDAEIKALRAGFLYMYALLENPEYYSKFYDCYMKYWDSPRELMSHEERMDFLLKHLEDREARGEIASGNVHQKLQKAYRMQVDGRRRRLYIDFDAEPVKANGLIRTAYVKGLGAALRPEDLHIYVNQTWIQSRLMGGDSKPFFGTLLHEFIHLIGYTHPSDIAPDFSNVQRNIVYESGWCALRDMKDKPPGSIQLTDDNSALFVD